MPTQQALIPAGRFWVVTLGGIRQGGTFGPFASAVQAERWASLHWAPSSTFVIPVEPPESVE